MDKNQDSLVLKKKTGRNMEQKNNRQNDFDKNRAGVVEKPEKKPFDKKVYRLKKYSKKYKLEQWEEQRKKRLLREYHKEIKNDSSAGTYKPKTFDEDAPDGNSDVGKYVRHPDFVDKQTTAPKSKRDPFQQAKEQFNKVKQEKLEKQKEIERAKEEKKKKLEEYKKKKQEKFKKLSKKTKKGQPVMTGRLELLLEKIQRS
ncbi:unnamed protein product [Arctia plantaginis]|uniref:Thyroid transcription factor 1-associated protein 26 n=1 Tax=Arctia plantaginis TaxID=874455 RepID=A0A8S0ZCM1_ARCPL|nr:unnamed protein product [Arctia plantaginis]CAB3249553.1 unnamed protein product [Arctia plantaginis]